MSSHCQQIKTEYEQLQTLKDEFILAYDKAKEGGDRVQVKQLKAELETAFIKLEEEITTFIPEEKILDVMEGFISKYVDDDDFPWKLSDALGGLCGLDSDNAWRIREQALRTPNPGFLLGKVAESLIGIDSERAWQIRDQVYEKIIKKLAYAQELVSLSHGLRGLDSDRAWQMREIIKNEELGSEYICLLASMGAVDSEKAWKTREECLKTAETRKKMFVAVNIASSMKGLDSEKAWQMREKLLNEYIGNQSIYGNIARSLVGLDPERAWQMRDRIFKQDSIFFDSIVAGLSGIDSERAWQMRDELFEIITQSASKFKLAELAYSLSWLNSRRAWQMRERMSEEGASEKDILISMAGNHVNWFKRDDV